MSLILCAGRDPVLLDTRAMVLESAGFQVVKASSQVDVINTLLNGQFAAVILCHTIPLNERKTIASLVQNHSPSTGVFLVSEIEGQQFPFGHTVTNDPRALVTTVRSALNH